MATRPDHWDEVYGRVPPEEVSWFQPEPTTSLRLVEACTPDHGAGVIDVGAGRSTLVDELLDRGFTDLTVLDVSAHALDAVRARLGAAGEQVGFVVGDVTAWEPARTFATWHDRAVFHFLTDPDDQGRYVDRATRAVEPGGSLVLATFAEDGPERCSGLPVCRWSAEGLADRFAPAFALAAHEREEHRTPGGAIQAFTWVVLRRA